MSSSADEHHRYVLQLEEQNEQMRAMVQARDVTIKSINSENKNLRQMLKEAGESTDSLHRELDMANHTLRVIRSASDEFRNATMTGAPERPLQPVDTSPIHMLRETANL